MLRAKKAPAPAPAPVKESPPATTTTTTTPTTTAEGGENGSSTVSLLGIAGQSVTKAVRTGKKRMPAELRIQKGESLGRMK